MTRTFFWRFLYILGCSGPWCAANTGGGGGGNGARNKEQADLPFLHVMWEWEMQERHFQTYLEEENHSDPGYFGPGAGRGTDYRASKSRQGCYVLQL